MQSLGHGSLALVQRRLLVLVLYRDEGPVVDELLRHPRVAPEAGVVQGSVAVLVHKVHVSLVPEEQLDNLGILSGDKIKMLNCKME